MFVFCASGLLAHEHVSGLYWPIMQLPFYRCRIKTSSGSITHSASRTIPHVIKSYIVHTHTHTYSDRCSLCCLLKRKDLEFHSESLQRVASPPFLTLTFMVMSQRFMDSDASRKYMCKIYWPWSHFYWERQRADHVMRVTVAQPLVSIARGCIRMRWNTFKL